MILPVTLYGDTLLRKVAQNIDASYPNLKMLVDDMFLTMKQADGVGLAAPQIGHSIRLFVIDASPMADEEPELIDFKKVFYNPQIISKEGDSWLMEEGCLSLPKIREDVSRPETVTIHYFDENWIEREETYSGMASRIIQHEYDHLEGILFVDHISLLRRRLLKSKLSAISKGTVQAPYRVRIPGK